MSDPWGEVDDTPDPKARVPEEEKKSNAGVPKEDTDPWGDDKADDNKGQGESDWTSTNYDSTTRRSDRRPRGGRFTRDHRGGPSRRGEGFQSERGNYRGSYTRGDYDRPYRGRGERGERGDRPRGRFPRGSRGQDGSGRGGKHIAERTKIKRHRLFENVHNQEVLFNETEQQIDPEKLSTQSHFRADKNWDELRIPENILQAIEEIGYTYPSKIQSFGIDVILQEGFENFIAQAPNGSGKTATFIIGSLSRLDLANPKMQIVCIGHTIELTNQLYQEFHRITSKIGATLTLLSKDSKPSDLGQIVVTVAGSFLKSLRSKTLDLSHLKVFVVDEADHLFDSKTSPDFYNGIAHAIRSGELLEKVQFLLFSATFNDQIKGDIIKLLKETNEITIKKEELMLDLIKHYYIRCEQKEKIATFEQLLRRISRGVTIAFVNTCDFAMNVCRRVQQLGHKTALLMGRDMSVDERNLTMQDFREGKYGVLVTTNLLARGIDNTKVTCVINFDLPRTITTREMDYVLYLHRSGRCSRFGRNGLCFNLITNEQELSDLLSIGDYYNIDINHLEDINMVERLIEENLSNTPGV